ncbi:MAG TPA: alkaline phosphatase D family protein, partial [Candidatus Woesebacteria bacterium]|nr:alkaline phosphatase D family protein [Candidatus Woesebacteria bacterium]
MKFTKYITYILFVCMILCTFLFVPVSTHAATLSYGAVLGAPTDTSIKIWVRSDSASTYKVEYKLTGDAYPGTITSGVALSSGTDYTGTISITGLLPNTSYDYRVLIDDVVQSGNGSSGTFVTLKTSGTACSYVFSLSADIDTGAVSAGNETLNFDEIVNTATPDFNVFLGDQIYGPSSGTQADIETYYKANWIDSAMKTFTKAIGSVFMWDDHELLTPDDHVTLSLNDHDWDAGKTSGYSVSRLAFDNYQGQVNPSVRVPNELYYSFNVCDTSFFMFDTRTHRGKDRGYESNSNRMLGAAQMAHLKSWLKNSTATFKFILSPTPWSDAVANANDSFYTFNTERQEIYTFLKRNNLKNVFVLSADQHNTVSYKNPLSTSHNYAEFGASPLNSSIKATTPAGAGAELVCSNSTSGNHYGIISVDTTGTPQVNLKSYRAAPYVNAGNTGAGSHTLICDQTYTVATLSPSTATVSSAASQVYTVSGSTTAISTLTITDASTATITATNDIRVRIPTELNMLWDTTDTTVTIGGGAAAKVSTTVSYEES